jgi:tetratricopeptide (TPR) repeat protein
MFAIQARADDDVDAAREHYRKGKRAYDLGHFAEAAEEYERAYSAKDDSALLFDLAQARRLAGQNFQAVIAYKAFLRNEPKAPNRVEVEKRIQELQATITRIVELGEPSGKSPRVPAPGTASSSPDSHVQESPTVSHPPESPTVSHPRDSQVHQIPAGSMLMASAPPPWRRPVYKKWWFWTAAAAVLGATAAAIAVGATHQPHETSFQVHSP